jgi:hypothetical protein
MKPPLESFNDKWQLDEQTGCWLWHGSVLNHGYGFFQSKWTGTKWATLAHRASWILHKGPIPKGIIVCHKCDRPLCVNPEHLFLGTDKDNVRDAMAKGRHQAAGNPCYAKGSSKPTAKLTEEKVRSIRAQLRAGESRKRLAALNGVCVGTIHQLAAGRSWSHVD